MRPQIAGNPVKLHVEFKVDDEYVMPDAGSVLLTIRGTDGVVIDGYNLAPQTDPSVNTFNIILPSDLQVLSSGSDFEVRYCRVDFMYQNKAQFIEENYLVIPFVPMRTNEESVRGKIGCAYHELPDDDINIYGAYLVLKSGYVDFPSWLRATDLKAHYANEALAYQAALVAAPSMQQRLFKSESKDNAQSVRNTLDMTVLLGSLRQGRDDALAAVGIEAGGSVAVAPDIFVVSLPTDPVTNA
ncbi:hypothetical protein Lumi_013 [Xylophilus phage Lumi]|nr:hypothetical protein Lumi_013 [Xylophilus phage Lumi]